MGNASEDKRSRSPHTQPLLSMHSSWICSREFFLEALFPTYLPMYFCAQIAVLFIVAYHNLIFDMASLAFSSFYFQTSSTYLRIAIIRED